MIYKDTFKELYTYCKRHYLYLGMGNPLAPILLIERECLYNYNKPARDLDKKQIKQAERKLVTSNLKGWDNNIRDNRSSEGVGNWFMAIKIPYNPLFPYKGQKNVLLKKIFPEGTEEGTSATWYRYQKLTDLLFQDGKKSELINFHQYIFSTKLSQLPSAFHCDLLKRERTNSVKKRLKMFAAHDFFRQFPVVIIATGQYPEGIPPAAIEEVFNAGWERNELLNGRDKTTFIRNSETNQLFIHTRQFGMNCSDGLLKELCRLIKPYIRISE